MNRSKKMMQTAPRQTRVTDNGYSYRVGPYYPSPSGEPDTTTLTRIGAGRDSRPRLRVNYESYTDAAILCLMLDRRSRTAQLEERAASLGLTVETELAGPFENDWPELDYMGEIVHRPQAGAIKVSPRNAGDFYIIPEDGYTPEDIRDENRQRGISRGNLDRYTAAYFDQFVLSTWRAIGEGEIGFYRVEIKLRHQDTRAVAMERSTDPNEHTGSPTLDDYRDDLNCTLEDMLDDYETELAETEARAATTLPYPATV